MYRTPKRFNDDFQTTRRRHCMHVIVSTTATMLPQVQLLSIEQLQRPGTKSLGTSQKLRYICTTSDTTKPLFSVFLSE